MILYGLAQLYTAEKDFLIFCFDESEQKPQLKVNSIIV